MFQIVPEASARPAPGTDCNIAHYRVYNQREQNSPATLLFLKCFSRTPAESAAKPPCATLEGHEQIHPAPGFLDHPVAGRHGEEEETGNGGNLFQPPVAQLPLEAIGATGAISP